MADLAVISSTLSGCMLIKNNSRLKNLKKQESSFIPPKTLSNIYRAKVIDAYRNRRIFTIFGCYNVIRNALLRRGWLEKLPPGRFQKLQGLSEDVLLQHAKRGNDYEAVAISKIIKHFPAFFVWQTKGQHDMYQDVRPYRNRIRRSHAFDFSTKVGLIGCAEQQHWFCQDGVAEMLYPRFFRLGFNWDEEQLAFVDEFRITQCQSLLRFLINSQEDPYEVIDNENGTVNPSIVSFALCRVKRQVDDWEKAVMIDIESSQVPDEEWNDFLINSSKVIHKGEKIKCLYHELLKFVKSGEALITQLEEMHPDLKWDGCKNLWILKPGYQCRGIGIVVRNNINDILSWCTMYSNRSYIVQKYIEKPLLIYRAKFDIRQYLLICIRDATVQLWLYKDCYLRISSQEYRLDDLDESIHLTNFTVQKKYKFKSNRDNRLPRNHMWSLEQFKSFLNLSNAPKDVWERTIYAGFRKNIIAVVLASLDETSLLENNFELYGCDFMLDENYNPVLIEINATPDLASSTEVTAKICPMVQQDLVKVVVDLPNNGRASTGLFELIYEINYNFKQNFNISEGLNVNGTSARLCKRICVQKRQKPVKKAEKKSKPKEEPEKKSTKVLPFKSKTLEKNIKSLKATAKEALALRYTMPK